MTHTLKWLGHSSFQLSTSDGQVLLIDPWLSGSPVAPCAIEDLPPATHILITHDHADHAGDCVAVSRHTGATVVAQPEIVSRYRGDGLEGAIGMNIGGTVTLGGVKATMVEAYHSSATGTPAGFILTLADGKVLYHAGDTGLHANMAVWGDLFDIDLAILPIGDHFTMDARQAAHALRMLRAKRALPMHYLTFPLLAQSADGFVAHAGEQAPEAEVLVIDVGGSVAL